VCIDNKNIATIEHGGFFGEMALLKNDRRSATIKTNSLVHVLNITSDIFWMLLFQNLNLAIFIELVAGLRSEEDQKQGEL
jgi:CRP-like cAMP-binding protein